VASLSSDLVISVGGNTASSSASGRSITNRIVTL
jgi:hypothetical protein